MAKDIENREDIKLLVDNFYKAVRADERIGYIFDDIAKVDWQHHLPIMYDFWETTLLDKDLYRKNAMKVHTDLNKEKVKLTKAHFDVWLEHFNATVDSLFEGPTARLAKERALSIATVMQIKVAGSR